MPHKDKNKNIVLFLGNGNTGHVKNVRGLEKVLGRKLKIYLLVNPKQKINRLIEKDVDKVIRAKTNKITSLEKAIEPFQEKILILMARFEYSISILAKLVPLFPYLRNPNQRSLEIASNKIEMRKMFSRYAPKISTKFLITDDFSTKTLKEINEKVGFPCVIKPASLSSSKLITINYYEDELKENLTRTFKKIKALYIKSKVSQEPMILVEELLEGTMYSVDAHVNSLGKIYFTPSIEIKTGRDIGHDDFFMYTQITPSQLNKESANKAHEVVEKAVHLIGLRSCTAHCELMRTDDGWKIIEIGARPGGFREELLGNSYGIKHGINDFLIHIGKKPIIKKLSSKYTCLIKFYPKSSGTLTAIKGLSIIKNKKYVIKARQGRKVGDYCGRSKDGYPFVVAFTLSAETRSEMLGYIRFIEKTIELKISKKGAKVKSVKKKPAKPTTKKAAEVIKKKKK